MGVPKRRIRVDREGGQANLEEMSVEGVKSTGTARAMWTPGVCCHRGTTETPCATALT